jgi:hypothetical protein
MTDHKQSAQELEAHLQEHLGFLQASADAYDGGFDGEAKRIAVSIRVLVHDTKHSKSLLGQLGRKSESFLDSALPITPANKNTHSGLVVTSIVPGVGAKYVAFLDDGPGGQPAHVDFDSWWSSTVFVDSKGRELSRKDLVLTVANQDGGAHIDPALDSTYADLSRHNSLGWTYSDGGKSEPMEGPERAALRQICHEVLKTLVPGYAKAPSFPKEGMLVGGMVMLVGEPATQRNQQLARGQKVGRNERCPCGSGTKYKRCCGALV